MDLLRAGRSVAETWLPRTRGDGPPRPRPSPPRGWASPHTRGWTPRRPLQRRLEVGFPAHAGMDPVCRDLLDGLVRLPRTRGDGPDGFTGRSRPSRLPRTRGDGPEALSRLDRTLPASPHTQGRNLQNPAQSRQVTGDLVKLGLTTRGEDPSLRRSPRPDQIDHLLAEHRRIRRSRFRHPHHGSRKRRSRFRHPHHGSRKGGAACASVDETFDARRSSWCS